MQKVENTDVIDALIKTANSDADFLSFFAADINGCFSHLLCEGGREGEKNKISSDLFKQRSSSSSDNDGAKNSAAKKRK